MNTFYLAHVISWCLIASAFTLIDARIISTSSPLGSVICPNDPGDPNANATLLPNPYNCSTYFICDHGVPTEMPCPGDLYFDPVLHVCNNRDAVNCQINSLMPTLIPCNNEGEAVQFFPNPQDCSSFLVCDPNAKGYAYLEYCPDGLKFNVEINVCDYPWNVNCS